MGGNRYIETVTLNKDLIYIGQQTFSNSSVKCINFNENILLIDNNTFYESKSLEEINFQTDCKLKRIKSLAFSRCNFTSIDLSKLINLKIIEDYCFTNNTKLNEVHLPTTLDFCGSDIFADTELKMKISKLPVNTIFNYRWLFI